MAVRKRSQGLLASLAVLLIDMQPSFLGKISKKKKVGLVSRQIEVIRECARLDVPLIVLEYRNQGDTLIELMNEVRLVPRNQLIIKLYDDGFEGTDLNRILKGFSVKTLVLMGVNASYCVKKTALSAVGLGYKIITGDYLIDNTCRCCRHREKDRGWYMTNGVFHEVPTSLPAMLSKRAKVTKQD